MKLIDKSVSEFSKSLASKEPVPGGGAAAALQGVVGASLIGMVASLTVEQTKKSEFDTLMKDIIKRADEFKKTMLSIIDRDTDAYKHVYSVFAMPKTTEKEQAVRNDAMQNALKVCTIIPFEIMQCSYNTLELAMVMVGKYNKNATSDLGVAVLSLKTAAESAWLNVLINLDGIRDEIFSAKYMIAGNELIQRTADLADDIHEDILNNLMS